jgi:TolA-binding protein
MSTAHKGLRRAALVILGAALLPASAAAATKFTKKEVEIQGIKQTELTKPTAPPKEKKETGPVISLEEFTAVKQEKIISINQGLIEKMQRLIRITPADDPEKPDYTFRLAELYAEQYKSFNFKARSLDQKIFEAKGTPRQSQLEAEQKRYEAESQRWLVKSVEQYAETRKYKKYARQDENLFRLGYLLQLIKKEELAREVFLQLIKDYPSSKYVPEAYLAFAEFYFDKGEMDNALKFYRKVAEFPKSNVYGYAVYKQGWCFANLGDYKKALEIFVDVIKIAQTGRGGDKRQNQALEREAKRDVVKAYARVAPADKAWQFFTRVGGETAPRMMEWLAEIYWEQGMFFESTKVYRNLIALNPQSPRLCEWQGKVVRNTLSSGTKNDQLVELAKLGLAYDRVMTLQVKDDVKGECKNGFHDVSKELALVWHKEAQKTKNPDTYKLVKHVYRVHLDRFSKEKDAVDMAFFYAEVLWVTEDYREAAEQYTKVIQMDPKGKYVHEAAFAAVLAWKSALNIDDEGRGPDQRDSKDLKPLPIPAYQQKMIAAFDTYIKYVPNPPDPRELVKIKYRKARVFYEYNHFDEAVKYFEDVVLNHPNDELAIYSANLLLDSLNAMKRTPEVLAWVEKFMGTPQLMKDEAFAKDMVRLRTESLDVDADEHFKKGRFKQCGISYLSAAESLPDHPRNPERLYNAGICFTRARLIGQAVAARKMLVDTYPKDTRAQQALYQIASNYQQIASYQNAADYFEKFASQFPGEKMAPQALANAYQFRLGLGDYDKAIGDLNSYIKYFGAKKPDDAAAKFFQMGQVYEREGRMDELAKHLDSYIKKWGKQGGVDRLIWAHFKLGELQWKRACPQADRYGACVKIERVAATGREKAFYEINRKRGKKQKIQEKGRKQCGPPTRSKITLFDRSPKLSNEAQGHFKTALALFSSAGDRIGGETPEEAQQRKALAQSAAAGAAFYQAERPTRTSSR